MGIKLKTKTLFTTPTAAHDSSMADAGAGPLSSVPLHAFALGVCEVHQVWPKPVAPHEGQPRNSSLANTPYGGERLF